MTLRRYLRVNLAIATIYYLFLAIPLSCKKSQPTFVNPTSKNASIAPLAFAYRYPGYPLPGEPPVGGLLFAIWPNGRFLRPKSENKLPREYIAGYLPAKDICRLREEMCALLYAEREIEEKALIIDAAFERIWVCCGSIMLDSAESIPLEKSGTIARIRNLILGEKSMASEKPVEDQPWLQPPPPSGWLHSCGQD